MKIGILCPSEIAIRRFMPALVKSDYFEFSGIGVNSIEERFGKNIPANANKRRTTSDTVLIVSSVSLLINIRSSSPE